MPHHSRLASFVVGAFCIGHLYAQGLWQWEAHQLIARDSSLASNAIFPVEREDFVLLPSRRNFGGT
jgi:hypothetical protein